MDLEVDLLGCIGYDNSKMKVVNDMTVCFLSGSNLVIWDLSSNERRYIASSQQGFQRFETCPKQNLIILVEYQIKPSILVYKNEKLIQTIPNIVEFEVLELVLSRDGEKLGIVQGCPTYELIIYDLIQEKIIEGENSKIVVDEAEYLDFKFNPTNNLEFAILNEGQLEVYRLENEFRGGEVEGEESMKKEYRLQQQSCSLEAADRKMMEWDQMDNIYLGEDKVMSVIRSKDMEVIIKKELQTAIQHILMTQMHVIVVYKSSYMEWLFKYDPQFINDKATEPLTMDKYYLFLEGQVINVCYDHFFNNIVLSTEDNSLFLLNIKGQNIMDDEDEESKKADSQAYEEEEDNNRIECDPIKYGPHSQTLLLFVNKLNNYDLILSVSHNAEIHLVDIQSRNVVRNYYFSLEIKSFVLDSSEKLMVMGTSTGCLRLLDSRDFNNIQTVQVFKFYDNKTIDFLHFYQGGRILVGSKQSKKVHVLIKNEEEYTLQGILVLPAKLAYISINNHSILFMMNYMVLQMHQLEHLNQNKEFDWKLNLIKCRKVDPSLDLGVQTEDTLILLGKDKQLKVYPKCEEDLYDYDLRIKTPGSTPVMDYGGYNMVQNIMECNGKYLVSGGKDGMVYIRDINKLDQIKKVQVQSLLQGGVSALSLNKESTILTVGGHDASLFLYNLNKAYDYENNTTLKTTDVQIPYSDLNKLQDDQIVNYKQIQLDAKNQQLKLENQKNEELTINQLDVIRNSLLEIIEKNNNAEEMEKLDKDEFCVNLERRDQIQKECEGEQERLKEQANQQIEIQQKIFSRIKEQTYDQMLVHLKAINGVRDNIIVYNYQVKKQSFQETKQLAKVLQMRKVEISEKYMRMEFKIKEMIIVQELCKNPDNYIVNVYPGKPENFVFNDYEKKEEIKEKKGEQVQKTQNIKNKNYRAFLGFTIFRNKEDGGKLEELKQAAAALKMENPEALEQMQQNNEEDIKQLQMQLEQKRDVEEMTLWDFLYSQLELYSNNQKRNQIIMIQSIIHSIKEEFNIEYELAAKQRANQIESINEKNKRMVEIQNDLKMGEEEFTVKESVVDGPEAMMKVNSSEVGMERYLSREERARVEAERIKEEERLLALQKDDAGIRALKQMMGGTLQEKKETPLTETLEREDWMDKPTEEMDDDQRAKLREFEVKQHKLQEERDKITKNLKNELMQLNSQTQDIQRHFDDKLLVLQKRKLEFDQRINEQYLVLITLVQSLLVNSERVNKFIEMQKFVQELETQISQMHIQAQQLEGFSAVLIDQKKQAHDNYDAALSHNRGGELQGIMNIPQIYQQVFDDNNMANYKKEDEENLTNLDQYKNQLFQLDPYYNLELQRISSERETDFDNFIHKIKENYQFSQLVFEDENQKNLMIQLFRKKFNLKVVHNEQDHKLKDLEKYQEYYRNQLIQQEDLLCKNKVIMEEIKRIQKQSVSDIEIMCRIKQGNVEIFQDRPVPSLTDAILIPQKMIENLNKEIKTQGGSQIEALNQIKNTKFDVAKAEYDKRKKNLELKQIEVKIKQIQMLKVKKEMQIALQKKDMKLNENELKNLNEQIDKIKDTTDKRILLIKKKEESISKEIQFIKKENQQLYVQGGNLSQAVKQRAEIKDMYEKKMNIKDKDEKTDKEANEKFKLISCVRRLHNHVVKQTEEIQILKEELTKLRYKTFTDFTNIGHQQI